LCKDRLKILLDFHARDDRPAPGIAGLPWKLTTMTARKPRKKNWRKRATGYRTKSSSGEGWHGVKGGGSTPKGKRGRPRSDDSDRARSLRMRTARSAPTNHGRNSKSALWPNWAQQAISKFPGALGLSDASERRPTRFAARTPSGPLGSGRRRSAGAQTTARPAGRRGRARPGRALSSLADATATGITGNHQLARTSARWFTASSGIRPDGRNQASAIRGFRDRADIRVSLNSRQERALSQQFNQPFAQKKSRNP